MTLMDRHSRDRNNYHNINSQVGSATESQPAIFHLLNYPQIVSVEGATSNILHSKARSIFCNSQVSAIILNKQTISTVPGKCIILIKVSTSWTAFSQLFLIGKWRPKYSLSYSSLGNEDQSIPSVILHWEMVMKVFPQSFFIGKWRPKYSLR